MIGVEVTAMQTEMILSYQSAIFIEKNSDKNGQLSSSFLAANQHICATVNFCQRSFPVQKSILSGRDFLVPCPCKLVCVLSTC